MKNDRLITISHAYKGIGSLKGISVSRELYLALFNPMKGYKTFNPCISLMQVEKHHFMRLALATEDLWNEFTQVRTDILRKDKVRLTPDKKYFVLSRWQEGSLTWDIMKRPVKGIQYPSSAGIIP